MTDNPKIRSDVSSGLFWVKNELAQSFERIRGCIETHLEEPDDLDSMRDCLSEIHQFRSVASVIQCYSAALLADEMRASVEALIAGRLEDSEAAFAALIRATLRLADFIELLARGELDHAAVFTIEVNELRHSRGEMPISHAGLFVRYMRLRAPIILPPPSALRKPGVAQSLAAKHFPVLRRAITQYSNGQNSERALGVLAQASDQLASVVTSNAAYQLWWISSAFVEAISVRHDDHHAESVKLLTKLLQVAKGIADQGEASLVGVMQDLAYYLLFTVMRAPAEGPRITAVQAGFQLAREAVSEERLTHLRGRMERPNVESLSSVARELRTELGEIKDEIDLAVRSADRGADELNETRERMGRVAATFSVLGLDRLAESAAAQSRAIGELVGGGGDADQSWMAVAEAVLRIEQQLENDLFEQAGGGAAVGVDAQQQDLREGVGAVLRESLVDIARIKSDVARFMSTGEKTQLETAANLLSGIRSGVQILGIEPAVELIGRLASFVGSPAMQGVATDSGQADRFADAVACIEYFLEARQENQPHTERLLIDLEAYLDRMESGAAESTAGPAISEEAGGLTAQQIEIDPEFREIFIDEAGEVLAELQQGLAPWRGDPANKDKLGALRRAFHTLKGSGRMVGAADIGDFGWAIENLLNRCLDGGLPVSAEVVGVVDDAVEMLPAVIDQFSAGVAAGSDLRDLVARAERVAAGDQGPVPAEEGGQDAELFAMFLQDSAEHVAGLQVRVTAAADGQVEADEELVRGLHTLRGSAAAVGLESVRALSEDLESLAASARLSATPLPAELLEDAANAYQGLIGAADQGTDPPDVDGLRAAIAEQQALMPTAAQEAAVDQELIEIFSEEAADLLDEAETELANWRSQPGSRQPVESLQRIFHTLKGSARTASAVAVGDVGQVLDAEMKVCLDFQKDGDDELYARIEAAISGTFGLLSQFRDGVNGDAAPIIASFAAASTTRVVPASETEAVQAVTGGESDEAAPDLDAPFKVEVPADEWPPDPDILDIFLGEGQELLESVDSNFNAWESDQSATEPLRDLQRDLHTLKGSARMAGLNGVGAVAHEMESLIALIERGQVVASSDVFGRLHHATDGLFHLLDEIKAGQPPAGAQALIEDLRAELLEEVEGAPLGIPEPEVDEFAVADSMDLAEAAEFEAQMDAPETAPDPGPAAEAAIDLGGPPEAAAEPPEWDIAAGTDDFSAPDAAELSERTDDFEELAATEAPLTDSAEEPAESTDDFAEQAGAPDVADEPLAERTDDFTELAASLGSATDDATLEPLDFSDDPVDEESGDLSDFADPVVVEEGAHAELVDIFLPEAAELVEAFDQITARWTAEPGSPDSIGEMLRVLHTLKGGARMAGLVSMGDIAHNLEGRLEKMQAQSIQPGSEFFTDLRSISDQFHALRDEARKFADMVHDAVGDDDAGGFAEALLWRPPENERLAAIRRETARVTVEQLDGMLNEAGEISIYRSRLDEQASSLRTQLREVEQTIVRIRDQLRMLENETETQIQARGQGMSSTSGDDRYGQDFDPLEMDRYSRMQELTRALSESVTDLNSLHTLMGDVVSETETLLLQQGRVNTSVQQGLMSTLMVPFSRQVQRLQRVLRQTTADHGKQAELALSGIDAELDRNVLERMTPMLEHILRNCVIHGIETATERSAAGKPVIGTISVSLTREGSMLAIELRDDGRGLDYAKIRSTAIKRGMIAADAEVSEQELSRFIFEPGFSTAESLTKDAGRGVGMDVVTAQVKQLGGSLDLASTPGVGARFIIRLPLSLAIAQALLVQTGHELYAVPLATIEGIDRIAVADLARYGEDGEMFEYGGGEYRVHNLAPLLNLDVAHELDSTHMPVILARSGDGMGMAERRFAIVVDALLGSRELVTKTVGPQVSTVTGVTGATILADGRVVLILDIAALVLERLRDQYVAPSELVAVEPSRPVSVQAEVMVIDDSITMRRVAERLLERNGFHVTTAKDGMDAMAQLQTESPDILLLDIEMPKADGFEVASFVRNNERLHDVPIIMITSRSGDKHRERAAAIGVNSYLIKPYQEKELIDEIGRLLLDLTPDSATVH